MELNQEASQNKGKSKTVTSVIQAMVKTFGEKPDNVTVKKNGDVVASFDVNGYSPEYRFIKQRSDEWECEISPGKFMDHQVEAAGSGKDPYHALDSAICDLIESINNHVEDIRQEIVDNYEMGDFA